MPFCLPDMWPKRLATVVGEVGDRCRPCQQGGIGRELLHRIALTSAPRAEFHQIAISLAQGNEANEEEELESTIHDRRLAPHTAHHEIDPFVGGEFRPALTVFI